MSRVRRRRVGRGSGSSRGKTCGRGTKGQKSRSGHTFRAFFEGGQMPLARRVPKRGFTNPFRKEYQVVNVGDLAAKFEPGASVTPELLREKGLVRYADRPVKVLGDGDIEISLEVSADAFSMSAREKLERAGGAARPRSAGPQ